MAVLSETALRSQPPAAMEIVKVDSMSVGLAWWGDQFEGTTSRLQGQGFPENPDPWEQGIALP